jgi:hypothetical protein
MHKNRAKPLTCVDLRPRTEILHWRNPRTRLAVTTDFNNCTDVERRNVVTKNEAGKDVKGYSMPAIGHRNVTVSLRVLAGFE